MIMLKRINVQRTIFLLTAMLEVALMLPAKACAQGKEALIINPSTAPATQKEMQKMVEEASEEFYQNPELKKELEGEIQEVNEVIPNSFEPDRKWHFYILTHGGKSMKFFMRTVGNPNENGKYPLFITLHGGGQGLPEENNDAWIGESYTYYDSVNNGILVVCRGITDTWDLHFQEDSYPLYDRLIETMIVNYNADPDRIYLHGYSAGGDGVYQITPRLADRFAAVNMSAGHPNDVSLLNVANCFFCQQAGVRDYYSEDAMRCVKTAQYDQILSDYREKYGFGYEHRTFIHVPNGHYFNDYEDATSTVLKEPAGFAKRAIEADALNNFLDVFEDCGGERDVVWLSYYYSEDDAQFDNGIKDVVKNILGLDTTDTNTNAMRYISQFTRSAAPEKLVWDLSTRASKREKDSFYWLEAAPSVNRGIITASYDKAANTITVEPDADVNGDFAILFHPELVDVTRPVTIKTPEVTRTAWVNPSDEFLRDSMLECGDPKLGCVGKIMYSALTSMDADIMKPKMSLSSDDGHSHKFIWETVEATEDADGELRYQCESCGEIQTLVPLTAYNVFNKNTTEKIRNAKKGATVKIETSKWISFHRMVMEALAERPDVTLEISFLDGGHKGNRCYVTIPNGTDAMSLVDKNGFIGFMYLGNKFGLKSN